MFPAQINLSLVSKKISSLYWSTGALAFYFQNKFFKIFFLLWVEPRVYWAFNLVHWIHDTKVNSLINLLVASNFILKCYFQLKLVFVHIILILNFNSWYQFKWINFILALKNRPIYSQLNCTRDLNLNILKEFLYKLKKHLYQFNSNVITFSSQSNLQNHNVFPSKSINNIINSNQSNINNCCEKIKEK